MQMAKEIRELTKQRDLAQSRIEDLLRMVGDDDVSRKVSIYCLMLTQFTCKYILSITFCVLHIT